MPLLALLLSSAVYTDVDDDDCFSTESALLAPRPLARRLRWYGATVECVSGVASGVVELFTKKLSVTGLEEPVLEADCPVASSHDDDHTKTGM